ncbi:hypothetical protein [Actinoplanes utahensis]|uniref:Uncharacterized protein n=1 Tax=Actinoplanes utahensis TaxID=1869 RepID=A0A0A6UI12_ACTUT|nr:hypothetical protein [Actinoplanes utahensis]KHD73959.1 hypothetical protein MB27_31630 [Actinoplanes utahensis]
MGIGEQTGVTEFVHHLVRWLRRLMPSGPRLDRLIADLEAAFGDRPELLTAADCRAVERLAQVHSRHLELHFDADATADPDTRSRGWPPVTPSRYEAGRPGSARCDAWRTGPSR